MKGHNFIQLGVVLPVPAVRFEHQDSILHIIFEFSPEFGLSVHKGETGNILSGSMVKKFC